eukprot:332784-Prymnesium_polylepis.1
MQKFADSSALVTAIVILCICERVRTAIAILCIREHISASVWGTRKTRCALVQWGGVCDGAARTWPARSGFSSAAAAFDFLAPNR